MADVSRPSDTGVGSGEALDGDGAAVASLPRAARDDVPGAAAHTPPTPTPTPLPAALPAPLALADFAVAATPLGLGNVSVVYRATHVRTRAAVALKVVRRDALRRAEARAPGLHRELLQEKAVGAALRAAGAPAAAALLGTFADADALYFAYELVDGCELWDVLTEPAAAGWAEPRVPAPLPPRAAAIVVATLARALAQLHAAGIAHRDVKPENVVLAVAGGRGVRGGGAAVLAARAALVSGAPPALKLVDFGSAKDVAPGGGAHNDPRTDFGGTPDYMSPEAIAGRASMHGTAAATAERADGAEPAGAAALSTRRPRPGAVAAVPRRAGSAPAPPGALALDTTADLWALGVVAYQALAGVPPFRAAAPYLTMRRVAAHGGGGSGVCSDDAHEALPLLFPPGLPADARDFVAALLQRRPRDRLGAVAAGTGGVAAGSARRDADAATPDGGAARRLPSRVDYDVVLRHPFLAGVDAGAAGRGSCDRADALGGSGARADGAASTAAAARADDCSGGDEDAVAGLARRIAVVTLGSSVAAAWRALTGTSGRSAAAGDTATDAAADAALVAAAALTPTGRARLLHLLALRQRLAAPPVAVTLAAALVLGRHDAPPPPAALSIALGAARILRCIAAEWRTGQASAAPCALGEHGPREVLAWHVAPRTFAVDGDGDGVDATLGRGGCRADGRARGDADSGSDGDDDDGDGAACSGPCPTVGAPARTAISAAPSTQWRRTSAQTWGGPFTVVLLAHPRVSAAPASDADAAANAAFAAALAAVARLAPPPRALLLLGHLTATSLGAAHAVTAVSARPGTSVGDAATPPALAYPATCAADLDELLRAVGAALPPASPTSVLMWGHGASGTAAGDGLERLPVSGAARPGGDGLAWLADCGDADAAARLARASCGAWLSGTRVLMTTCAVVDALQPRLRGGAGDASDAAAECAPVDGAAAVAADGAWLREEVDDAPAAAQHALVVLRDTPPPDWRGAAALGAMRLVIAAAPVDAAAAAAPTEPAPASDPRFPTVVLVPPLAACGGGDGRPMRLPILRLRRRAVSVDTVTALTAPAYGCAGGNCVPRCHK